MRKNKKQLPDREIVELYLARNEDALVETDGKYKKLLFQVSYNILFDRQDSEECVNDTYLAAWNSIPPTVPQSLRTYLLRIDRNLSLMLWRKKHREKRLSNSYTESIDELSEVLGGAETTEKAFEDKQLREAVVRFFESLDERSQMIFTCRYYCLDGIDKIAGMLKISQSTVFKELAKIRMKLKEELTKEGLL